MKKILLSSMIGAILTLSASAQSVFSTNITAGGNFALLNSGVNIKTVIVSSANAGLVQLYDAKAVTGYSTNGGTLTNITPSYISRSGYSTNIALAAVVGGSGYTNYYTNSGWFSYNVTNSQATNKLTAAAAYAVAAGTMGAYPADISLVNGLSVTTTTNVAISVYYYPR